MEVIVSDNGSTDGTVAVVEQYQEKPPNLRVVDSSDRRGAAHAGGCRRGLAFCDADDEVAPGWVAAMGEAPPSIISLAADASTKSSTNLDTESPVATQLDFKNIAILLTYHSLLVLLGSNVQFTKLSTGLMKLCCDSKTLTIAGELTCRHKTPLCAKCSSSLLLPRHDRRFNQARLWGEQCSVV